MQTENEPQENHEYDVAAMAKEIGSEMFPVDPPKEEVPANPTPTEPSPAKPEVIDPVALLNQELPLPKSWKKEQQVLWDKADKDLRTRITEREAEVSRGISMYQQGYKAWDELTKPFSQLIQQHQDVNPVQLFQNLLTNHLALLNPATKVAKAQELLKSYGIDLGTPEQSAKTPPPVDFQPILGRIDALEKTFTQQTLDQQTKLVETFFSDPQNKYADEVAPDIARLLQTGQASDLPSAYQQAIWLNPAVRVKVIAEQNAAEAAKAREDAKNAEQAAKLNRGGTSNREPPKKTQSMDDTINSVIAKHYPTH